MNKVTVLIEGYAHPGPNDSYVASPTCSLVESNGKKLLVDPGANQKLLAQELKKKKIRLSEIDGVFLSHYHPDHFLAIRLFPNADIYDGQILWREDKEFFHKGNVLEMDIELLPTPGHASEDTTVVVKTAKGIVCIAPDVFWWEDGKQKSEKVEDLLALEDPFVQDQKALLESRKKVLEIADWIIPGHGKIFNNPSKT